MAQFAPQHQQQMQFQQAPAQGMYNPSWAPQTNFQNFGGMQNGNQVYDAMDSDSEDSDDYNFMNLEAFTYKPPSSFSMPAQPDFSNAQVMKPSKTYTVNNPVTIHSSGSSSVSSSSTSSSTSSGSHSSTGSGSSTTTTTVTEEPNWFDKWNRNRKEKKAKKQAEQLAKYEEEQRLADQED